MRLIDSDIIIDSARGEQQAISFLAESAAQHRLCISTITRLELLAGCRNAQEWNTTETLLRGFVELVLTPDISAIAAQLFTRYRLSHGLALADGLIAATAISNNVPLASKNQRHFRYIDPLSLLPYPPTP